MTSSQHDIICFPSVCVLLRQQRLLSGPSAFTPSSGADSPAAVRSSSSLLLLLHLLLLSSLIRPLKSLESSLTPRNNFVSRLAAVTPSAGCFPPLRRFMFPPPFDPGCPSSSSSSSCTSSSSPSSLCLLRPSWKFLSFLHSELRRHRPTRHPSAPTGSVRRLHAEVLTDVQRRWRSSFFKPAAGGNEPGQRSNTKTADGKDRRRRRGRGGVRSRRSRRRSAVLGGFRECL